MQWHYWWWLAALGLGIVEMLTGTFYLLVVALGCAGAGLAAYAGMAAVGQFIVAAVVTLVGWLALHRWRPLARRADQATTDRDVLLDIGERVIVTAWDAGGRADVTYRGARWAAELASAHRSGTPAPGEYRILGITGNRLQLEPFAPAPRPADPPPEVTP